ncbi:hypothetical protein C8Q74DRAFT_215845 [Fomes fomentarius]|nr:hypothetical protein C8Q74DRAFT_215845 [Fomes fomentarius]
MVGVPVLTSDTNMIRYFSPSKLAYLILYHILVRSPSVSCSSMRLQSSGLRVGRLFAALHVSSRGQDKSLAVGVHNMLFTMFFRRNIEVYVCNVYKHFASTRLSLVIIDALRHAAFTAEADGRRRPSVTQKQPPSSAHVLARYRSNSQHSELPRQSYRGGLIKQRDIELRGGDNAHDAVGTLYEISMPKLRGVTGQCIGPGSGCLA